jgi:hypothetical protein
MAQHELVTVLRHRRAAVIGELEQLVDRRTGSPFDSGDYGHYLQLCDEERSLLRRIRDHESIYFFD